MSKFSNYLKNLIESSGESIAFISRKSNIERTSIHKALTDERILPYASVQALAQHFKLPLDETATPTKTYNVNIPAGKTKNYRFKIGRMVDAPDGKTKVQCKKFWYKK